MNTLIMMGNLTRDPELMYMPNQTAVCRFGIAVNRKWTDAQGQKKEDVCFIDCTAFGKPGETIKKYMAKGQKILITGRLHQESWVTKENEKRSKHAIIVEKFEFVGTPQNNNEGQATQQSKPNYDPPSGVDDDVPF